MLNAAWRLNSGRKLNFPHCGINNLILYLILSHLPAILLHVCLSLSLPSCVSNSKFNHGTLGSPHHTLYHHVSPCLIYHLRALVKERPIQKEPPHPILSRASVFFTREMKVCCNLSSFPEVLG